MILGMVAGCRNWTPIFLDLGAYEGGRIRLDVRHCDSSGDEILSLFFYYSRVRDNSLQKQLQWGSDEKQAWTGRR